ncbi:MAG: molybdopterin-containing oxidoreductase family protein [Chloroflexota bacterium]|nr:molybdopterin-dependent oxidoreductase [Chloroflexota bacterium]MBI5703324.1 molybdopterin-dependent oxidoreductase [Chloroflexota bacterium]
MAEKISRRSFLKLSAAAGSAVLAWEAIQNAFAPVEAQAADAHLVTSENDVIVPGVCTLCTAGCGVLARVADGRVVKLEGSPMHPINQGALCPKGQAAPELLYNPDRLTSPLKRDRATGQTEAISWDEAAALVAEKLSAARDAGHPESVAMLYGNTRGQQRSFFSRFMQAVGSPNFVSKESLNVAAAKLGMLLTQGIYALPVYDLENSNYILSFGANLLEAGWNPQRTISGWTYGRRGRPTRNKIVIIDPRQGIHGAKADEWIPIKPGTDAALALGMAYVIIKSNLFDSEFVHEYSFGFDDFAADGKTHKGFKNFVLENYDPQKVEQITGVPATTIARLAGEFATNKPAVAILPGKGGLLNGSIEGVYAAMAVHMLNALVGSIETKGGVLTQQYFPLPDYPALPSDAVAKKGLAAERVDGAGTLFPLARHAYQAVADRVLEGYPLEVLFLYDANPVYEVPGGAKFVEAFKKIPFIVSFSSFMDESAEHADLILPEPTFLERWGDDHIEGLGYPGIALRQPAIAPLYDTMDAADFLLKVAEKMGGTLAKAFPWKSYQEVLQFRLKDIGMDWETLKELGVWLVPGYRYAKRGGERWVNEIIGRDRAKSPRDGHFDFFSRELYALLGKKNKADLASLGITQLGDGVALPHHEEAPVFGDGELMLNVFTLMSLGPKTEAANMPTLMEISGMTVGETWNSWLEMNPETARELGLKDKDMVWVESPAGKVKTKLRLVKALRPDVVNIPYNFGHTAVGRFAKNRGVNGLELLNPASEPLTGLAAFTNTRVKVSKS